MRNKLNSIPFPQLTKPIKTNKIHIPGIGEVSFFKQSIPEGKIKTGRIVKRSSGWYLIIVIDTVYRPKISVNKFNSKIGIDTGFSTLLTLSNGRKYENSRELRKGENRIGSAQRGNNTKLISKLYEKQSNRRIDRNHKISHDLIQNHDEIYITNDDLKGQSKLFGKSVTEASIAQLRKYIIYKGSSCGRKVVLVDSHHTTMTCSICGSRNGPTGLNKLAVRHWVCSACGAQHDRDINAAQVVLNVGLGQSLELSNKLFDSRKL